MDEGSAQPNAILNQIRNIAEETLKIAHEMKIVKTQDEADQEEANSDDEKLDDWAHHPKPGVASWKWFLCLIKYNFFPIWQYYDDFCLHYNGAKYNCWYLPFKIFVNLY